MIFHPRTYRTLRNHAVLRLELGDRAFMKLFPADSWWAVPAMFGELQ